MAIMMVLCQ